MFNDEVKERFVEWYKRRINNKYGEDRHNRIADVYKVFQSVAGYENSNVEDCGEILSREDICEFISSAGIDDDVFTKSVLIAYKDWYSLNIKKKKVLYNAEQKQRYIQDKVKTKKSAVILEYMFKSFAPYEADCDADICTQSVEAVTPILTTIAGVKSSREATTMNMFESYIRWCLDNNVPNTNAELLNIKIDRTDNVRNGMISGPQHLQEIFNRVFRPIPENTMENVYRAFYWMAFAGLYKEDAIKITADNIDFIDMVIHYGGGEFPIYREASSAFHAVVESTSFVYKQSITKRTSKSDSILRGIKAAPNAYTFTCSVYKIVQDKIDDGAITAFIPYNRIQLSGVFYRAFERERAGYVPDFSDDIEYYIQKSNYKSSVGCGEAIAQRRNSLKRRYMEDYKAWKIAFGY